MPTVTIGRDNTIRSDGSVLRSLRDAAGVLQGKEVPFGLVEMPIVPGARTLAYSREPDGFCHIAEFPPCRRSIVIQPNFDDHTTWYIREIALPYMVVKLAPLYGFLRGWVYFRNSPTSSWSDMVYDCALPNVQGGLTCSAEMEGSFAHLPFQHRMSAFVEEFFGSRFTLDHWTDQYLDAIKLIDSFPKDFDDWQQRTREDSSFVLQLDWISAHSLFELARPDSAIKSHVAVLHRAINQSHFPL